METQVVKLIRLWALLCPREVVQSGGTTLNEAEVTSSNPPSSLLCGHVKKKKDIDKW